LPDLLYQEGADRTMRTEPSLQDISQAHERIEPFIHRTPVLTSATINRMCGGEVFFKCENFQKAGAFKIRGACNSVFSLSEDEAKRGVATHSSGNHAAALALAARWRGSHPIAVNGFSKLTSQLLSKFKIPPTPLYERGARGDFHLLRR